MKKLRQRFATVATICVAFVVLSFFAQPAFAIKPFLEQMRKAYTLSADQAKCNLCHEISGTDKPGKGNLNAYAKELKGSTAFGKLGKIEGRKPLTAADIQNVQAAIKEIATKDSDGDGATNEEELSLGSMPGDSSKKPAENALAGYRKAHPAAKPTK